MIIVKLQGGLGNQMFQYAAGKQIAHIHDRMPVILEEKAEGVWLDSKEQESSVLKELLIPYPADDLRSYEVSKLVNSPKNDTPEVIQTVT